MNEKVLVLVINLNTRKDRFLNMENRLKGVDFNRIKAVEADKLNPEINKLDVCLSNSEKACISSHIKALNQFLESDKEFCCILEDDVVTGRDFIDLINLPNLSKLFPNNCFILKLETFRNKVLADRFSRSAGKFKINKIHSIHYGTAAYLTTKVGARNIIDALGSFELPADHIIFDKMLNNKKNGHVYQLNPACCIQEFHLQTDYNDQKDSDILHDDTRKFIKKRESLGLEKTCIKRNEYNVESFKSKALREVKRIIYQLISVFRPKHKVFEFRAKT